MPLFLPDIPVAFIDIFSITERYRPLPSFSQKLRFLIDIQIAIFDLYHSRLHSALEAYVTQTSSIARTIQGVSRDSQIDLQGLKGIERLTRIYGSAEYLEKKMRDWSDDVFFLELWDELQDRARRSTAGQEGNLAGPMTLGDVADKTSSAVGGDNDQGALFDETAGAYRRLRIRTEDVMQDSLISSLRDSLRPYTKVNTWSSLASPSNNEEEAASLALSAELDDTVQLITSHFGFLARALAAAPLRRVARQATLAVQAVLWTGVLMHHTFSRTGVAQLARDVGALCEVFDRYVGAGQAEMGMRKMTEALVLLGLSNGRSNKKELGQQQLGLEDVEGSIFRSNESGREVLEELGLEAITESDARSVLERRLDFGS